MIVATVMLGTTAVALVILSAFLATRRNHPLTKDFREQLSGKGAGKMFIISTAFLVGLYIIVSRFRQDILPILMKCYFCYVIMMMSINFLRPPLFTCIYSASSDNHPQYLIKWMKIYAIDLVAVGAALPVLFIYWFSDNWIVMNCLAALVTLFSIEITHFKTLTIASITMAAFFFYDIYFVFFTPIMITVAKKIAIPVKIVWPREPNTFNMWLPYSDTTKFTLLGLGDIMLPGMYISLLSRAEARVTSTKGLIGKPSLTRTCIIAYAISIIIAMCALHIFKKGQPVLLYITPCLLVATYALLYGKYDKNLRHSILSYVDEEDDEIVPFKPSTTGANKQANNKIDEIVDSQDHHDAIPHTEEIEAALDDVKVDHDDDMTEENGTPIDGNTTHSQ